MQKLRFDMFPTIEYNGKKYGADEKQRLCPLIQLISDIKAGNSKVRILLNGEGAIGKSTNLLALKIAFIKNNVDYFYFNLRDANPKTIEDQGEIIDCLSSDTVIILDSHDEGKRDWADELVDIANRSNADIVIVASRYTATEYENECLADFVTANINTLSDLQIKNVLAKSNVSASSENFDLLHNTMFLSLYLQIKLSGNFEKVRLENETDILREYFYKLFREKNEDADTCDYRLSKLGELFFSQCVNCAGLFSAEEKTEIEKYNIPTPLKKIFTVDIEDEIDRNSEYIKTLLNIDVKEQSGSAELSERLSESLFSTIENFFRVVGEGNASLLGGLLAHIPSSLSDESGRIYEIHSVHVQFLNYVIAVYLADYLKKKSLRDEKDIIEILLQAEKAYCNGYCSEEVFYYLGQISASKNNANLLEIALNNKMMLTATPKSESVGAGSEEDNKLRLRKIFLTTLFGYGGERLLDKYSLYPHLEEFVDFDDFEDYYCELAESYDFICKKLRRIEGNIPLNACLSHDCTFPMLETIELNNETYISKGNCLLESLNNGGYSLILGCKNSVIPQEASYISSRAFYDCQQLKAITIPPNINNIGEMAFSFCSNLKYVEIPASEEPLRLSTYSFANVGASVEKLILNRELLFDTISNTEILKTFKEFKNVKYLTLTATQLFFLNVFKDIEELYIGAGKGGYTNKGVFEETPVRWCKNLKKLVFSSEIACIENFSIYANENLEQIIVETGNVNYFSSNNCLIDRAKRELICGCKNSVIPNDGSVSRIGRYAFYRCKNLKTISLPEGVEYIGSNAFAKCECLETVYLPASLKNVEDCIFADCPNLKNIIIPKECNKGEYILLKRDYRLRQLIKFI